MEVSSARKIKQPFKQSFQTNEKYFEFIYTYLSYFKLLHSKLFIRGFELKKNFPSNISSYKPEFGSPFYDQSFFFSKNAFVDPILATPNINAELKLAKQNSGTNFDAYMHNPWVFFVSVFHFDNFFQWKLFLSLKQY